MMNLVQLKTVIKPGLNKFKLSRNILDGNMSVKMCHNVFHNVERKFYCNDLNRSLTFKSHNFTKDNFITGPTYFLLTMLSFKFRALRYKKYEMWFNYS